MLEPEPEPEPPPPPPLLLLPESIVTEEEVTARPPTVVLLEARATCRFDEALATEIETGLVTAVTTTDPETMLEMVTHSTLEMSSPSI